MNDMNDWCHVSLFQAEAEREEKYFNYGIKKEAMEEKMQNITQMKVTCYACKIVSAWIMDTVIYDTVIYDYKFIYATQWVS